MDSITHLITIIIILVNVAFVTLLERKILGYSQLRKGPNKVSIAGILQPIRDALKLFSKELVVPYKSRIILFSRSPIMRIALALILWSVTDFYESTISMWIRRVVFLILLRFGVYPLLLIGWSSNRKYALLGAIRAVAQTVSYEIRIALILLAFLRASIRLRFKGVSNINADFPIVSILPVIVVYWVVSCLAETNRTPFDFAEGESELVSGFNVEYGSSGFTMIFMREYSMILLFRFLCSLLAIANRASSCMTPIYMLCLASWWIWVRSTYPRYRYDKLINLAWKTLLPASLIYLVWTILLTSV